MSALAITLIVLTLSADAPESAAAENQEASEPRSLVETNRAIFALVRREATAKSPEQRDAAVRAMAALYLEIVQDPRLTVTPLLQQYKARLWRKLVDIKKDLEREIALAERREEREHSVDELAKLRAARQEAAVVGDSLSNQLALVEYSMGGPGRVFAESRGAFGGAPVRDHGEELVRLIERTISPEFWEVNGGPGAIFYYAPLHALVISATDDIHRRIGGAAGALRAAGP
ncbi:MAG: hypothetical protein RIC55_14875 [Pirellulaceae bacterium]